MSTVAGDSDPCSNLEKLAAVNVPEAFGLTLANLLGFGGVLENFGVKDNLSKIRDRTAKLQQQNRTLIDNFNLTFAKLITNVDASLLNDVRAEQNQLTANLHYVDELLQEKIETNQVYVAALASILIVVLLYLFFQPTTAPTTAAKQS